MIYKCKVCGATLNIKEDNRVCVCEYCGTTQSVPNTDDEKITKLFERGNELIRNCQFDDAQEKFEEILTLRNDDPEVYWSLLMAKYGVTYEKDPYTGNMIPTIHRTQDISIFLEEDYRLTIQYADDGQKAYYEKTAKIIDNIQKKYNIISEREEPFDIFICYKQTDDLTKKDTEDYKIAYELYNTLTKEGYKVFFSHVTLEDKIGEEYEPYIYAALKSSRILLAIGTKEEYYDAVWVKNEWSRFMFMMRNDHSKRIIPICLESSILPNELNRYQSIQIKNNIVWKEDLVRSIAKILDASVLKESIRKQNSDNSNKNIKSKSNKIVYITAIIMALFLSLTIVTKTINRDSSNNLNIQENEKNNGPADDGVISIANVIVGSLGDSSINDSSHKAITRIEEEFGDKVEVATIETAEDDEAVYYLFKDILDYGEYDVIVTGGNTMAYIIEPLFNEYPNQKWWLYDMHADFSSEYNNVVQIEFNDIEASYCAGYMAAMITKTNNIGYVCGFGSAFDMNHLAAYVNGAKAYNSNIDVKYSCTDSLSDGSLFSYITQELINKPNNCDVIYVMSSIDTTISTLDTIGYLNENDRYIIGYGVDYEEYLNRIGNDASERLLCSCLDNIDNAIYYMFMNELDKSVPYGKKVILGIEDEYVACKVSETAKTLLGEAGMAELKQLQFDLANGNIDIESLSTLPDDWFW